MRIDAGLLTLGLGVFAQLVAVVYLIARVVLFASNMERRFTIIETLLGDEDKGLVKHVRDLEERVRQLELQVARWQVGDRV